MPLRRVLIALLAAAGVASAQAETATTTDWVTFGRFLSLVNVFVQAANAACAKEAAPRAECDPAAVQRAVEDILGGRNPDANALALEIFADMPPAEREKMLAIGRSMVAFERKQVAARTRDSDDAAAIRARKDLAGMGLTYHDRQQFLDAVKRADVLAVRLFLAGRAVDAGATDVWGNSALAIAQRGGNAELTSLLSAAAAEK